jgi:carbonic anhydrase/acetyltransferase-like protein (isoleucine patch superfamily)
LALAAAEGVEDGVVEHASNGVLSVGRDTIVNDSLLLGAACRSVSNLGSSCCVPPSSLIEAA